MSINNREPLVEEDNGIDTYVATSGVEGYGLYASRSFSKGEIIIDYALHKENWYYLRYDELSDEQICKNWYIMVDNINCMTNDKYSKFSYINHSRTPNCLWKINDRIITASYDILKGSELFIDYRIEPRPTRVEYPHWI